jgi:2-polyprenyl-3-methyl-5-hydroxy-6-metoxy-1,4-benzoquinol methylase
MEKVDERFIPKDFEMSFPAAHRHFSRYLKAIGLAKKIGKGELWLDCACGCGYGTEIMSNFVSEVHGFDIDSNTISYARENYKKDNIKFFDEFPKDRSYDMIFSLETIEHLSIEEGAEFIRSLSSVLKKDGVMVVTTPIAETTGPNPTNPFHKCEYSLRDLISAFNKEGLLLDHVILDETEFTDGSVKDQGYFRLIRS